MALKTHHAIRRLFPKKVIEHVKRVAKNAKTK
jgi:HD superfamily phosphodiesterase